MATERQRPYLRHNFLVDITDVNDAQQDSGGFQEGLAAAEGSCPVSNALRGNVETELVRSSLVVIFVIFVLAAVLFGIGLPDENAHAPNERLDLGNFHNGIVASAILYEELSKV